MTIKQAFEKFCKKNKCKTAMFYYFTIYGEGEVEISLDEKFPEFFETFLDKKTSYDCEDVFLDDEKTPTCLSWVKKYNSECMCFEIE